MAVQASADAELRRHVQELERAVDYQVIPIRNLVAVQIESALAAANFLNETESESSK